MKSHRIDSLSLMFGLLFLGLGAWWWLARVVDLSATVAGWVAAVSLVTLGTLGIVTSVLSHRSRPLEAPEDPRED